jgi:hypothetical protein
MNTTKNPEETYASAHAELNELYQTFHDIPGYIRQKTGEELALQDAKKVFGRFNPDNLDEMKANTNNGDGFTVQLQDGSTLHLKNQLELYNKVVEFNKSKGGFCDENFIKHTNSEDFIRLTDLQFTAQAAKDALIGSFTNKKAGYAKAREIETMAKSNVKPPLRGTNNQSNQSNQGNQGNQADSNSNRPNNTRPPQIMRTPLLSSIPNTFRQAAALFQNAKTTRDSIDISSYMNANNSPHSHTLSSTIDRNITTAKDLNSALSMPVSGTTKKDITKLSNDLAEGNDSINELVNSSSRSDCVSVGEYNKKMKKEMEIMKELASKHPLMSIRHLLVGVIKKTLDSLVSLLNKTKAIFSKTPTEDTQLN